MYRDGKNPNYINFFLQTDKFKGVPKIMEKDKCDDLIWVDINNIPDNTIISDKISIKNYLKGIAFVENNF